jgi:hypothetical protein
MAVEVSSYKEFLADRHGTNHAIKIFPKLPLGALAKTYLRGIGTDHIQSQISNYQLDQDNSVALPPNINDSFMTKPAKSTGCIIIILLPESKHSFHGSKFPGETKLVT